jgi:hypothetical protein
MFKNKAILQFLYDTLISGWTPVTVEIRLGSFVLAVLVHKLDARSPTIGATVSGHLKSPFFLVIEGYAGMFGVTVDVTKIQATPKATS